MQTPCESHWKATKRILRYIRGTIQFGIHCSTGGNPLLVGFTNSDWADDPDDQKYTPFPKTVDKIGKYIFPSSSSSVRC